MGTRDYSLTQKNVGGQKLEGYRILRVTLGIEDELSQNLRRQANMASSCNPVCGHPWRPPCQGQTHLCPYYLGPFRSPHGPCFGLSSLPDHSLLGHHDDHLDSCPPYESLLDPSGLIWLGAFILPREVHVLTCRIRTFPVPSSLLSSTATTSTGEFSLAATTTVTIIKPVNSCCSRSGSSNDTFASPFSLPVSCVQINHGLPCFHICFNDTNLLECISHRLSCNIPIRPCMKMVVVSELSYSES